MKNMLKRDVVLLDDPQLPECKKEAIKTPEGEELLKRFRVDRHIVLTTRLPEDAEKRDTGPGQLASIKGKAVVSGNFKTADAHKTAKIKQMLDDYELIVSEYIRSHGFCDVKFSHNKQGGKRPKPVIKRVHSLEVLRTLHEHSMKDKTLPFKYLHKPYVHTELKKLNSGVGVTADEIIKLADNYPQVVATPWLAELWTMIRRLKNLFNQSDHLAVIIDLECFMRMFYEFLLHGYARELLAKRKPAEGRFSADKKRKHNANKRAITWGREIYKLQQTHLSRGVNKKTAVGRAYDEFRAKYEGDDEMPPGLSNATLRAYVEAFQKTT